MNESILPKIFEIVRQRDICGKSILSVKRSIQKLIKQENRSIEIFYAPLPLSIAAMSAVYGETEFIGVSEQFLQQPELFNSQDIFTKPMVLSD